MAHPIARDTNPIYIFSIGQWNGGWKQGIENLQCTLYN